MIEIKIQSEFIINCPHEVGEVVAKQLHEKLEKIKIEAEPFITELKVFEKKELTLPPQYVKLNKSTLT